jgi:hypothetical protein
MAFVQIIEFKSSDIDGLRQADDEWERATEGKRTARRRMITRDLHDPNRYFMIVFFDSYESAMADSELPETQEAVDALVKLADRSPTFYELDVVVDRA